MKNFRIFLFSVILLFPLAMFAQQAVKGKVTEASSGSGLPGVDILIKGTTIGTSTDFDGNYILENVKTGDILVVSYMGFKTQELTVNSTTINVQLVEDTESLDEVVVIGYGSVKKEDLTGSADLITSDDFNKGNVVSAQQLINGKVAGVSVTSGGGAPGEGQNIVIRGLGSLSLTSSPLIVVDGVPLNDGGVGGSRNVLNLINPNDIESMVVLKDASATSIYGSRAANGVIMITTKKGKDTEFKFNVNSSTTLYTAIDEVDVMNADQFSNLIEQTGDADAIARLGNADTNWQDQIYVGAIGTDHSISALGNAWGVPMRASVGHSDHEGTLKGDEFKRTTASLNLSPSFLDDHLKIELNARGMYTENKFANRDAIGNAASFDPTQSVYDENSIFAGYYAWTGTNGYQLNLAPTNPVAQLALNQDTAEVRRLVGNAKVDYKLHFFPDVTATVNVGLDKSNSHGRNITSEFMPTSDTSWNGSRTAFTQEATNKLFDAYVTYNKTFNEDHSLNFVVGHSYQSFEFDNYSYDSEDEEDGNTYEFIDKSKNVLLSYFGRLNYDYKGKYLATATLRADASSKLNPDDRWGYFSSYALAWNIHKEDFMEDGIFNELKLRVGYGEVGNVNGLADYKFLTSYLASQSTANYQFGNSFYQTYRPEPLNEELKWEVGRTFNVGIDYGLLDRRITGSVNVYLKETQDLIASSFVDPFTNFGNRIEKNIGDMENRGIEFVINTTPVKTDDFEWNVNYNISFNDNEVTKLPFDQAVGGISGGVGNNVQVHTEGEAPYSFLVYEQVYDATGSPIEGVFVDRNGDDIINDNDRYINNNPYADVLMGLNTNFRYKNFDLAIVTRASLGNYAYDNVASSTSYLRRATENSILTNLHTDQFNSGFVNSTENSLLSDYYISEASFFKIDNITLGYNLPNVFKDTALRVYGSMQNVATITDYKGLDPEIDGGIDNNFYPRPRSIVFGVNIDF
ncbi:iron complex outermembrane recepter protein [Lutibacter oricola]|uniref:Iron complex outermembrane recepter protein n=1 Tax=Lutibacter oricola TaxID=762486 RepID=A0A1H3GKK0_9FLAO|nr:SusC/RagA family TonB-linked outer membrane protein [Lutibacter oricola]SDY02799.1 iron complex outermembrane recepter protein [Lutibacter oricola]